MIKDAWLHAIIFLWHFAAVDGSDICVTHVLFVDLTQISLPVEMLSNLASYLMGGGSAVPAAAVGGPSPTPSTVPTEVAQGTVIALQELRCTEEEDWLLVDPDAISSNNWSGHSGRCSKGTANGCFSGSIVMEGGLFCLNSPWFVFCSND